MSYFGSGFRVCAGRLCRLYEDLITLKIGGLLQQGTRFKSHRLAHSFSQNFYYIKSKHLYEIGLKDCRVIGSCKRRIGLRVTKVTMDLVNLHLAPLCFLRGESVFLCVTIVCTSSCHYAGVDRSGCFIMFIWCKCERVSFWAVATQL